MRGPCALPLAPRLGPKKPLDFCATLRSSLMARYPGCRKAGRASNNLRYLVFFNCFLSIVIIVENARNGDRSIACDSRHSVLAEVSVLEQCIENLVPVWSVHTWLCPRFGTWNVCRCIHFWVSEVCRYGLTALTTSSRSHLRAIQPHQCSHDVVLIITATSPRHHLVVAALSQFRVSQCRVTLDHCW